MARAPTCSSNLCPGRDVRVARDMVARAGARASARAGRRRFSRRGCRRRSPRRGSTAAGIGARRDDGAPGARRSPAAGARARRSARGGASTAAAMDTLKSRPAAFRSTRSIRRRCSRASVRGCISSGRFSMWTGDWAASTFNGRGHPAGWPDTRLQRRSRELTGIMARPACRPAPARGTRARRRERTRAPRAVARRRVA